MESRMTITEQKAFLSDYQGLTRKPQKSLEEWFSLLDACSPKVTVTPVKFGATQGVYEKIQLEQDGKTLTARCIHPADAQKHPLILMYHDLNRGVRGWHHMTRFLAFGYGVAALESQPFLGDWKEGQVDFRERYWEALLFGRTVLSFPWVSKEETIAFGEGFGGGLALLAAALLPGSLRCVALNPLPGDFRGLGMEDMDELDLVNIAPLCQGEVLMGTCLMDTYAPPKGQAAIFNHLHCKKMWKLYPKYMHERVNFFENEMVAFL